MAHGPLTSSGMVAKEPLAGLSFILPRHIAHNVLEEAALIELIYSILYLHWLPSLAISRFLKARIL